MVRPPDATSGPEAEHQGYLARIAHLRDQLRDMDEVPGRELTARRALEWLDVLAESWQKADLAEEKSDVIHAVYERIVVGGPRFVGVRLAPVAYRYGLALALPEVVMARPFRASGRSTWWRPPPRRQPRRRRAGVRA